MMPAAALCLAFAVQLASQAEVRPPQPPPRMQVLPLPRDEAAVELEGREISRYYFSRELFRPFLYPLIGPSGKSVTRMGHPRDPNGHSHHNSVWISHHDVGGVGFWNDAATSKGRIVHRRVVRYEDADDEALIDVVNGWVDEEGRGKTLLEEQRTMRFRPLDEGQWLLVLDVVLAAPKEPVTLGKTPFGLVGVRMAKTIGVHDGGGTIRNSEGGVNEAGVFWKPARWCDYSGPIAAAGGEDARKESAAGITLMDHPINPNHPTVFHVRDDGWMGSSLTFDAPRVIEPGAPLKLRYGLWVHGGIPEAEAINTRFADFAQIGDPPPLPEK
jgi:hypothetical protein